MKYMPPHLGELPNWNAAERVAIDIETRDEDLKEMGPGVRRGAYITGVSFALDDGTPNCPAWYLPIRHQGGGNYDDPMQPLAYLREQAKCFRGIVAGANLQYDLDFLAEAGIKFTPRVFRDVQISGPLLEDPVLSRVQDKDTGAWYWGYVPPSMSLDALAQREGLLGKDEAGLLAWAEEHGLDPKKDMWRAPAAVVAPYAVQDVRLPLQVLRRHEQKLRRLAAQDEDDGFAGRTIWDIYELECRLLPVLLKMRRRGVAVNLDKVDQVELLARAREGEAAEKISARSGMRFDPEDINKAEVLAKHLKADGIECPLTPKTKKPSVKAAWLDSLDTPVAEGIKECRKWNKVRTTFCESIRKHEIRGRIHCTFNQLRMEREDGSTKGAAFGRLSSSGPNLQQQPARDPEIGPLWRSIYVPDDGGQWACLDFSSQEPRWITHYAEAVANSPTCKWPAAAKEAARAAAHACRTEPDWDNHSMMAAMMYDEYDVAAYLAGDKHMKHLRGDAKTIFLGLCYGMGGGKLCLSLGLPAERRVTEWSDGKKVLVAGPEGQALLDRFHARVPYVRQLATSVKRSARANGFIRTALGRHCRFPRHPDTDRIEWLHKGLNRLIQGTSADQTKLAMIMADEAGIRLQLQVHDELDLTIWDRKEAETLADIMVESVKCNVPTKVDIETGPDWGSIAA